MVEYDIDIVETKVRFFQQAPNIMIHIADFKILEEWKKLGYVLKADVKKPFAWTTDKSIPMYDIKQVEKK